MQPDPSAAGWMVEAQGIHKYFGHNHVLRGIDLTVRKGEVVVIVGPSGSGKSTFLRTINHLDVPDRGSVRIDGALLGYRAGMPDMVAVSDATLSEQRRQIGMVFQQFNLFSHMTALDNVMSGPVQVLRVARAKAAEDARRLLALVGLEDKAASYPDQLSGGQQQRVAIARALAMHPKVMLFDEPTSSLDPEMVHEVLQVMLDLSQQGMTMIIVTHEIQFANKAANRILFMEEGSIIEQGTPAELVNNPRNERTQRFLRLVAGGI
ncbi:MAG TPA: amino acid ABC transporter ATP-binding protein [Acetobacteraceae bacterium]|nr:amino acid ABC transporter ATP-binding protein [Acetobacteraceae bacterium]